MATPAPEVEVLLGGLVARGPTKGSFALNMLWRRDVWDVRKGFGTVAEVDSLLSKNIDTSSTEEWGYVEHLGSYAMRTAFGHDQIVSVFRQRAHTGGEGDRSTVLPLYSLHVYDLTTRERWEEGLYRRTSEITPEVLAMARWYGNYETARDKDNQSWYRAEAGDFFWFQEFDDVLFFGSKVAGVWAYLPGTYNRPRRTMVDSVDDHEWAERYSESACVIKVALADGLSQDAYPYLDNAELTGVVDCAVLDGHVVYATERRLWFSDKGFPTAVIAVNGVTLTTEYPITAIAEQYGSIFVWTERETWHFQPAQGDLFDTGRITRLSENVGCIGPSAVARLGSAVVWADTNGVYQSTGTGGVTPIGGAITAFFTDHVTNPLTSFYQQSGHTGFAADGPRTRVRFDPRGAHLTYAPELGALILGVPGQSAAMVLSDGEWSMWSTESMVYTSGAPAEAYGGSTANIPNPWFVALRDDLFCVAGPYVQTLTDSAQRDGGNLNDNTDSRAMLILEHGRGGALDRSISSTPYPRLPEDRRSVIRKWFKDEQGGTPLNSRVYIDEWIPLYPGYALPVSATTSGNTVLLPISVVVPDDAGNYGIFGTDNLTLYIRFDATHWTPVGTGVGTNIDYVLPPERQASVAQWVNVDVVAAGTEIRLIWDVGGGARMDLINGRKSPLIYIPMAPTGSGDDLSAMGLSWGVTAASTLKGAVPGTHQPTLFAWEQYDPRSSRHSADDVAQAVDYAYKTDQVGLDEGRQLKARGLWARIMSHGNATTKIVSAWTAGVYNVLVGSDQKGWQAQVLDHSGTTEAINQLESKTTVRTRIKDSGDSLRNATFNTTNVTHGDVNDGTAGTYIIGDEQVSEIAVSSSTKGSRFSWMVFGFMRNRAERITIESLTATFRVTSRSRRRRGR